MGKHKMSAKEIAYIQRHRAKVEDKFFKDGQAPIAGPFWIVRRITVPTKQFNHLFGVPFRHPSIESAKQEADYGSARNPGDLLGVFEFTGIVGDTKAKTAASKVASSIEELFEAAA